MVIQSAERERPSGLLVSREREEKTKTKSEDERELVRGKR